MRDMIGDEGLGSCLWPKRESALLTNGKLTFSLEARAETSKLAHLYKNGLFPVAQPSLRSKRYPRFAETAITESATSYFIHPT